MGREFSWKTSAYTKICSDHFYAKDFVEAEKGIAYQRIRLKPGSLPRTDRATGYIVDPKLHAAKRKRTVRVVAEATSNFVHQLFVEIDESLVDKIRQKFPEKYKSLYRLYLHSTRGNRVCSN